MKENDFFGKMSKHLQTVLARALAVAEDLSHKELHPVHILLTLTEEQGSLAQDALRKFDITEKKLLEVLNKNIRLPKTKKKELPELSEQTREMIEKSFILAHKQNSPHIGTEHLLAELLKVKDEHLDIIFEKFKITPEKIQKEIDLILDNIQKFQNHHDSSDNSPLEIPPGTGPISMPSIPSKKEKNVLKEFTENLSSAQKQEELDPVIGREKEIDRIIHILCRRNKNNPILLGEPGVGKTAIVEGLAKRIAEGKVPAVLQNKKILNLDLTLVVAGTIYRGEFEDRLQKIIKEVSENPKIILFIDEIHNIIGAGSNQGTLDAANILKPALARGKIRCIGATTLDEYKKYIAGDPALDRRFQSIHVSEPNKEESKEILKGIKKYYEIYHRTKIDKSAIEAAVELSSEYIHDNFLPDKAIDLIDEACALVRSSRKPIKEEKKLFETQHKLSRLREKFDSNIENYEIEKAEKLEKEMSGFEKSIKEMEKTLQKSIPVLPVKKSHVIEVLSNRLKIDKEFLSKDKIGRLTAEQKEIEKNIFGQKEAIENIFMTLKQKTLGLHDEEGPASSFLFAGPKGSQRIKLAKELAKSVFFDEEAFVNINLSEFNESISATKLLGAPAGYVGFKQRNPFLDKLTRRPQSIIYFDNLEKAHPNVLAIIGGILEKGLLTLGDGKELKLHQAIVIASTELPKELLSQRLLGFGGNKSPEKIHISQIEDHLKKSFSSELLDAFDEQILFERLSETNIRKIIDKELKSLNELRKKEEKESIKLSEKQIKIILEKKDNLKNLQKAVRKQFFEKW